MKYSWLIISLLVVLLQSCNTNSSVEQTTRTVVVEVYDQVLYEDQILNAIPVDASGEDSTSIRNSYINSWINRQLMVKQAEANLPVDQKDVEIKLEKYRQDLLIFSYQNQLLLGEIRYECGGFYNPKLLQCPSRYVWLGRLYFESSLYQIGFCHF